MDVVERMARAIKDATEERFFDYDSAARAAIAAMFDWMEEPGRDKVAFDTLPTEQWKQYNLLECLFAHRHMLAEMRKEALGPTG